MRYTVDDASWLRALLLQTRDALVVAVESLERGITSIEETWPEFGAGHHTRYDAPPLRPALCREQPGDGAPADDSPVPTGPPHPAQPDNPRRPTNSADTVYQLEPDALDLLRTYGTDEWDTTLAAYLTTRDTLAHRYARERAMARIPVTFNEGMTLTLTPGGQNVLIKEILESAFARHGARRRAPRRHRGHQGRPAQPDPRRRSRALPG